MNTKYDSIGILCGDCGVNTHHVGAEVTFTDSEGEAFSLTNSPFSWVVNFFEV